jgi:hypothetical protein
LALPCNHSNLEQRLSSPTAKETHDDFGLPIRGTRAKSLGPKSSRLCDFLVTRRISSLCAFGWPEICHACGFYWSLKIARRREFITMSASQRVDRGFHQLGLLLAATLLAIGLPLMVGDGVRLKLWDAGQGDILVLVAGVLIALVGLGIACLAVYGVVRAIGWVIGGFAA